jgi:anthranilate phosphoribosyltransferase
MSELIREMTTRFSAGRDLGAEAAEPLLDEMISSSDEAALAELFRAWNQKGIAADEIYAIAKVLRDRCVKVKSRFKTFVDIVGTGGSAAKTFNVSTASAFIVAGAGVPVAKHGNRAATSSSGSADVLGELGIRPDIEPELAEKTLNELGICFMFAPKHHRLSPTLAKVRRGLGFPTVFNCVGPLCNPADVPHQVIGVWSRDLVPIMANALARLGTSRSWIVNGHDKLDEISMTGHSTVAEVHRSSTSMFEVNAGDVDLDGFAGDLPSGCNVNESAAIIRSVLDNKMKDRDAEKLVLLNSAAAIYVTGKEEDLHSAYLSAIESVRSGAAARKLFDLSEMTRA